MNLSNFRQWCHQWHLGHRGEPLVMGIVNCTPDSFSDGGQYLAHERAVSFAQAMLDEGADIIDIGGESSRPGADAVSIEEEMHRILSVIAAIRKESDCIISVDTVKPEVMEAAIAAGANFVNDISAGAAHRTLSLIAEHQLPICIMHMLGVPKTMQAHPRYPKGVLPCLEAFFQEKIDQCLSAGIAKENIILDPGFGFGKTMEHNLCLLDQLERLTVQPFPLLMGLSRKHTLGLITGKPPQQRVAASVVANLWSIQKGAAIVRVHDVMETRQAILMQKTLLNYTKTKNKEVLGNAS